MLPRQRVQRGNYVTAAKSPARKLCYCGRVQQGSYVIAAKSSARKLCYCGIEFGEEVTLPRQIVQRGNYVTAA